MEGQVGTHRIVELSAKVFTLPPGQPLTHLLVELSANVYSFIGQTGTHSLVLLSL